MTVMPCPACHHPEHDPGSCPECPRCELHVDEAREWLTRHGEECRAASALIRRYGFVQWGPPAFEYDRALAADDGVIYQPTKAEWLAAIRAPSDAPEEP